MRKESWGQYKRSFLDHLIEKIRLSQVSNSIKGKSVLDLGCGYNARLLTSNQNMITRGVGVDIFVNAKLNSNKIKLIRSSVDTRLKLPSNNFDLVISLAVIEHVLKPEVMLSEAYRLLKRRGSLLITTPSSKSKFILEFLANKLKIISNKEIADHKRYYNKTTLTEALTEAGFKKENINIRSFELGLNILAEAKK